MCDKTIHTRCVTFISSTIKIAIKRANVLSAKALDDKDNYILFIEAYRISITSVMDRRIYCLQFFLAIKIVWYGEFVYIDGAEKCECGVECQRCISGTLGILIGVG